MASMIDVVFLLLIFFLSTMSFNPLEESLDSQITQAAFAAKSQQPEFEPILIRVVAPAEATHVELICDDRTMPGYPALQQYLTARRAVIDVPVIVQGSADVPFEKMTAVLDVCHAAGFTRIAFSPREYSG